MLVIHTADVEGAAEGPIAALPADITALLVLFVLALAVLGGDGEDPILHIQLDILFLETGQLCLQHELVARVADIGAEIGQGGAAVAEELALKVVKNIKV